jgi:hypothetical protein
MATEHLILGGDLLEGDPRIVLPGGRVWPMSDDGEPLGPRAAARPWPDGYDRPARPGSRFAAVVDLGQRWAAVEGARGLRTTVRWSHSYPGLWLWAENGGAASPPWDGRARCLGVEPATGDRADGLAAAIARGEAVSLAPGEVWRAWVELEVGRVPIP